MCTVARPKKSETKKYKDIPKTESIPMLTCFTKQHGSGDKYFVTYCMNSDKFSLWKCCDDGFERIKTSDNPLDFTDDIPWEFDFVGLT